MGVRGIREDGPALPERSGWLMTHRRACGVSPLLADVLLLRVVPLDVDLHVVAEQARQAVQRRAQVLVAGDLAGEPSAAPSAEAPQGGRRAVVEAHQVPDRRDFEPRPGDLLGRDAEVVLRVL